jgi:hypothetical protein
MLRWRGGMHNEELEEIEKEYHCDGKNYLSRWKHKLNFCFFNKLNFSTAAGKNWESCWISILRLKPMKRKHI